MLFPYLFLICAEGFSTLLNQDERDGSLNEIKVFPNAPSVSHLLFVDDSIILCQAKVRDAQKLQDILHL
jgi:hypothetical protein